LMLTEMFINYKNKNVSKIILQENQKSLQKLA